MIETTSLTLTAVCVGVFVLIASPMPRPKPEMPPPAVEKQPASEVIIESSDLRPDTQRVHPLPEIPLDDVIETPQAQKSIGVIEQKLQSIVVRVQKLEDRVDKEPAKK